MTIDLKYPKEERKIEKEKEKAIWEEEMCVGGHNGLVGRDYGYFSGKRAIMTISSEWLLLGRQYREK